MKKISIFVATLLTSLITFQVVFAKWGLENLADTGLPQDTPGAFIARIVSYALGFIGIILIVMIIYGGFLYMTGGGNEKQTETAKNVLTYAIIGAVVIFSAYIIARLVISALTSGATPAPTTQETTPPATTLPTTTPPATTP